MSPNYPNNYGNNVNCDIAITVNEGKRILLVFKDFNVGQMIASFISNHSNTVCSLNKAMMFWL